jgi:putative transposase
MVGYRRNKFRSPDTEYFLTITSRNRARLFSSPSDFELVLDVIDRIRERFNLKIMAWAILYDHIHLLVVPVDADYSKVVYSLKKGVGAELKKIGAISQGDKIWQDRFWEHTVKDDEDHTRCVEYIHYNPVKHGQASAPSEWKYSSFHKYVERGKYPKDWGDGMQVVVKGAEYDV